jgi:DNA-binding NarL/FixJ family response regulator
VPAVVIRRRPVHATGMNGDFTAMVVVARPVARSYLVERLRAWGAIDVVEAASPTEARARARHGGPRDLCVVDLSDGVADTNDSFASSAGQEPRRPDHAPGLILFTELRAAGWQRIVILVGDDDPYATRAALTVGVRTFLVLRRGGTAASSTGGTAIRARSGRAEGPDGLSAREVEVLALVGSGRSNKEIGTALDLSALTVKSHLARIARKLGTGDRAEMVALTLRAGIIS